MEILKLRHGKPIVKHEKSGLWELSVLVMLNEVKHLATECDQRV